MIASLEDAWRWYESARSLTQTMARLGMKHWADFPWEGNLGRDEKLRELEASTGVGWTEAVRGDLDDLCVLLLFSVFEATVRARVLEEVKRELPDPQHPAVIHAVEAMNEAIEHGSFFKVLEPYKRLDADLVEQVNQVRQYRNWVAHGRRGEPANVVEPQTAYDRLRSFLSQIEVRTTGPAAPQPEV